METLRILDTRDDSTLRGKVYLSLCDAYKAGAVFDASPFDPQNPEIRDILKTIDVLENKWIYAHSYLRL